MPRPHRPFLEGRPLGFAHRGGAALFPENTLEAFRGALEFGLSYLETDLHATRDGVLVCHHDETVDRTTNGTGRVKDFALAELRELDAGYRFTKDGETFPARGKGITIPTLEEVVALGPHVRLNVEIKQDSPDIAGPLVGFIESRALADRFCVAGENDDLVQRFRRFSHGAVTTSAGANETRLFWTAALAHLTRFLPLPYDALQVPEEHDDLRVVTQGFVDTAHRRGLQVHVWTVNDEDDMRRLLDMGVDGVMTDRPDILARVLGRAP